MSNEGKSMVKITVECNGEVDVLERDAAFIIAYSVDDNGVFDNASLILGNGNIGDMGEAVVRAIHEQDKSVNHGISLAISRAMVLESLCNILNEEEE